MLSKKDDLGADSTAARVLTAMENYSSWLELTMRRGLQKRLLYYLFGVIVLLRLSLVGLLRKQF